MEYKRIGIILILLIYCNAAHLPSRNNLHHFMDKQELSYYFETDSPKTVPEYEIVDLWKRSATSNENLSQQIEPEDEEDFSILFTAFQQPISLTLKPNGHIISSSLRIVEKLDDNKEQEILSNGKDVKKCHFIQSEGEIIAAVSNCQNDEMSGIVLLPESTLEIRPLNSRLKSILELQEALIDKNSDNARPGGIPHIVKRASQIPHFSDDFQRPNVLMERKRRHISVPSQNFFSSFSGEPPSIKVISDNFRNDTIDDYNDIETNEIVDDEPSQKIGFRDLKNTVEVGLFFDEACYHIFAPFFNYDNVKLYEMILAYMNAVQALYYHPSLGQQVDIVIVYIEIMKRQPMAMPHYDGERGNLLDSFCEYQRQINPGDDTEPNHWDMGLYISGLDFFAVENGRRNGATMGLATVGGVCISEYACIIAELGTTNVFGKPYPSAGFTSVFILAHEIGHNLGMHHDSLGNTCSEQGYVMSPSRGTQGETTWSTCSAEVIRTLGTWASCLADKSTEISSEYNAWKYYGYPGQFFTAKKQCEILLIDKDAVVAQTNHLENICQNLHCTTPHRSGYYFAGPALEGTDCGNNQWCIGGYCSLKKTVIQSIQSQKGGWSPWKSEKCTSSCIYKSKGYQIRRRSCNNPQPINTDAGCEGSSYEVSLCDDKNICKINKKLTALDYATTKCKEFSRKILQLDGNSPGIQAYYEENRLWMACSIFCRRKDTGVYYTPRLDLNDLGMDPYFPDGTWCHHDGLQNYYCLERHCLPEGFKFPKKSIGSMGEDVPIPGNAIPNDSATEGKLLDYLSINLDGKPLLTKLRPSDVEWHKQDWSNNDYLELPKDAKINN